MKATFSITLILTAAALALTGCRSKPAAKPKEYVSVPLFMAGQEIPGDDQEKYLYNGTVKMYSVGRIVDPGSGTMRESGTVYRIERGPQWNLIPQYDANPESFARKAMQEQYANPMAGHINQTLVSAKALKKELGEAKKEIADLKEKCELLNKANSELISLVKKEDAGNKMAVQNMKLMQKYIQKLERRIEDLKMQNFGGRK